MIRTCAHLAIMMITFVTGHTAWAIESSVPAIPNTFQGRIADANDHPLPGVRVGLKMAGIVTQTDGTGRFILARSSDHPLAPGKDKNLDSLELDKDGYQGQTIDIKDPSFFNTPLVATMISDPLTEDQAAYSRRMSMGYNFPMASPELGKFNRENPDISADDWKRFFAAMDSRKMDATTERVIFQAYIPRGTVHVKAMFLISRHGMGTIDHPKLREFADRHGIALVGLLGNPVQRGFYPVDVIDEDIAKLGRLLHHQEIATAPFFSFGHSNGTGFTGILPSQRPDRAIAWVSYHSGTAFHLQFPGVEKVPGLVMHGNLDPFAKNGQEQVVKNLRRNRHAPIAMMMEGNVAHAPVDKDKNATWAFIIQFCEAAMRIRLGSDGTLRPVVIEQGWLGGLYDRAIGGQQKLPIAAYGGFAGDRDTANWLPDKTFAEVWQTYGTTDPRHLP